MTRLRALLLAGGEAPPADFVRASHRAGDLVIAADSGLLLAGAAGLAPDLVVGDFDSLPAGLEAGHEVRRHPTCKDASDLELALEEAAARGAGECLVLGALGGRLDHTLFNVVALLERAAELGVRALVAAPGTEVFLAGPGRHPVLGRQGCTCSLLPLDATATLSLEGFDYPLRGEVLRRASTRGLSNVVRDPRALVEVREGLVLVVLEGVRCWPNAEGGP